MLPHTQRMLHVRLCAVAVAGPEPLLLAAPSFCGAPHQLAVRSVAYGAAYVAYGAAYVAGLQRLTDLWYALLVILRRGARIDIQSRLRGAFNTHIAPYVCYRIRYGCWLIRARMQAAGASRQQADFLGEPENNDSTSLSLPPRQFAHNFWNAERYSDARLSGW